MKQQFLLDQMEHIHEAYLMEAKSPDCGSARRRSPRVLRTALIAACVCLALVGGAFAAAAMIDGGEASDYTGEVRVNPFTDETEERKGVQFIFEDMRQFQISDFSAEVQTYIETKDATEKWWFDFDSWEDAEAQLGFDLPGNTVLSTSKRYEERLMKVLNEGIELETLGYAHCYGNVMGDSYEFWVHSFYTPEEWDPVLIEVTARLNLGDAMQVALVRGINAGDDVTVEEYTAKNGVTFTIGYPNYGVGDHGHAVYYQTQFAVDGVLYVIQAASMGGGNMEHQALEALKAVLDGFVF